MEVVVVGRANGFRKMEDGGRQAQKLSASQPASIALACLYNGAGKSRKRVTTQHRMHAGEERTHHFFLFALALINISNIYLVEWTSSF